MTEKIPFVGILASGVGITGEAIFDYAAVVITNHKDAGIIDKVKNYNRRSGRGLRVFIKSRSMYYILDAEGQIDQAATNKAQGEDMARVMEDRGVTMVVSAGYDNKIHTSVYDKFPTFNAHPAPLDAGHPDFGGQGMHGLSLHEAVLYFYNAVSSYRQFDTEATIHQVDEDYDGGKVFARKSVPLIPSETAQSLQQRIKLIEADNWREFINGPARTGKLQPLIRSTRVVLPGEEHIWKAAIKHALAQKELH